MATYFELDPCSEARGGRLPACKANQWRLGVRDPQTGKTEFTCFDCASNVYVRLTKEAYQHLAGGD